ncbi:MULTISPECIES: GNAT family N-acetyltransferase [unclassified Clostridium]|uniref:GNAT family N-acetyltransferase n=1 Tax=unclassified Clostridium TaxID=2614128 RepID=UPI0002F5EAA3|nr:MULTISPECIES: GNAT family N-acetyltransferase [unclassified Clostridium]MBN1050492.1 GNAT family N-acetyltransferase [Clostridium botulinum]MBN1053778.1 GNAT family N-acetyltransferase [Clostridium botulinum]NFG42444.1 GNAT family N-acetyltransferase [Clostridium botulinum]NFN95387.1 GNAT family N-acetyltransferase [Clostridium botulinum]NFR85472.1 GNAT family N-acetyltransferase [Clostridium botulinum]
MDWKIKKFNELTLDELYEICKARYEVFGCEQRIYQENDFDDIDKKVYHLFLMDSNKIAAYARLIPSGITYNESSIGRVLVLKEYRRKGIAFELMKKSVDFLKNELNEETIVVSSQLYVKKLYESVGFKIISDIYDEVDIPHVKMKM